jgi:uncharacterized RDD family membrane protein YckC
MEQVERYQPVGVSLEKKLDYMATASSFSRLIAFLIDGLAIWGLNQIIVNPVVKLLGLQDAYLLAPIINVTTIATGVIFFLYFILMTYFFKATLGKMITGIHVINKDGGKLTFSQVIFRELIGRFINKTLWYIPTLTILFTESRIGLHDYFADTYVVKNSYYEYKKDIKKRIIQDEIKIEQEDEVNNDKSDI